MDSLKRSLIENTSLLLRGFTDGGHETISQVWFSSSARSSDSIDFHQNSCSIACLYDEGIRIEDKVAVKNNGEVKPYLSGGLRTRVLCLKGSGAVAGTGSTFREVAGGGPRGTKFLRR